MTCQALLAGLFPPTRNDPEGNWNEKLKWQPIPIHVISASLDNYLLQDSSHCQKLKKLLDEEKGLEIYKAFDKKYEQFYAALSQHTGRDIKNAKDAFDVIDILTVEVRWCGLR